MKLLFAKEFTPYPFGGRPEDGPFNGEKFREELLAPKFASAHAQNEALEVDLHNVHGLSGSFMRASFGKLADHLLSSDIRLTEKNLKILTDSPYHELCRIKIWQIIGECYEEADAKAHVA